ncbi:hypothetical protein ACFSDA_09460 [Brachybacterium rhamnosum]|uniref:Uncharacterized protein n=1 Tax=Brachybacterium rhamnosum TaxID=173361 RepID=A0ABW4PYS8_9MICO
MATFAVDSSKQQMIGTGVVEPVMEWVEVDGKRRPGDNQARHGDTGMPLWAVECVYRSEEWGRASTLSEKVTVGAMSKPSVQPFRPVSFDGLSVSVRVDRRTNSIACSWSAESIAGSEDAKKAAA